MQHQLSQGSTIRVRQFANLFVILISSAAALGGLLYGYDTAVISGAIGFLGEFYGLSTFMQGFVTAAILIGGIIGVLVSGFLSDWLGRKKVLAMAAVLFALAAVGSGFTNTVTWLVVARIVGGIGIGMASVLSTTYISEVSPPYIRGRLSSIYQLATVIGIAATFFVNAAVAGSGTHAWDVTTGWRWMLSLGAIPAIVFFLVLFVVPESPRWLQKSGREQEAFQVLEKINGREIAEYELGEIKRSLSQERNTSFSQLFKPGLRAALMIGIMLAIFQQFVGINAIMYYAPTIFQSAGMGQNAQFTQTVVVGIINFLFTLLAIWLIDKIGRKALLLIGAGCMTLFLLLIGGTFYFHVTHGPLILIFILGYVASFAISMGPVVWVMIPEIFPNHSRARAASLATVFLWAADWVVTQFFPTMLHSIGGAVSFWIFMFLCIVAFVFVLKFVPETKDKSLEEIERFWLKN
ncbi:sugar porter family MFS transporter [Alicyclobacillus kakegawensis]|uniref:sugar porter family MFS transporter n=1 Tax=Alicyclobacillus kakegawensis TaxID=392012 RepID=UPI00082A60D7|nr:sugar porter family MFS transporter [Alicyclobacillus kakegawensis]